MSKVRGKANPDGDESRMEILRKYKAIFPGDEPLPDWLSHERLITPAGRRFALDAIARKAGPQGFNWDKLNKEGVADDAGFAKAVGKPAPVANKSTSTPDSKKPPIASPGSTSTKPKPTIEEKAKARANLGKGPAGKVQLVKPRASRSYLKDYVRANGNMSVERRMYVVGEALSNLGYSDDDAYDITLDAPLNASMYNEQAILRALEYADSISRPPTGARGDALRQSMQPKVIPMPEAARRALMESKSLEVPGKNKVRTSVTRNFTKVADVATSIFKPINDRIGNLPVPGGIGSLFVINLLFLAAIVPAHPSGRTRLELLWLTLMNRTELPEAKNKNEAPASPLVQAALDIGEGIKDVGAAVGTLGNASGSISKLIQGGGDNSVGSALIKGMEVGASKVLIPDGYIPPSNTGATPPPPPMPPTQPGVVTQ